MAKRALQVDLNEYAYNRLSAAAGRKGMTLAELLRRALNIDDYLAGARRAGGKVLLVDQEGAQCELFIVDHGPY